MADRIPAPSISWQDLGYFMCEKCNLTTSDQGLFQAHHCRVRSPITAGISYSIESAKYTCSLCRIDLPEAEFIEHLEAHVTLKPYCCKYCPHRCETRTQVFYHLGKEHPRDSPLVQLNFSSPTKELMHRAKNNGKAFYQPVNANVIPKSTGRVIKTIEKTTHVPISTSHYRIQKSSLTKNLLHGQQMPATLPISCSTPTTNVPAHSQPSQPQVFTLSKERQTQAYYLVPILPVSLATVSRHAHLPVAPSYSSQSTQPVLSTFIQVPNGVSQATVSSSGSGSPVTQPVVAVSGNVTLSNPPQYTLINPCAARSHAEIRNRSGIQVRSGLSTVRVSETLSDGERALNGRGFISQHVNMAPENNPFAVSSTDSLNSIINLTDDSDESISVDSVECFTSSTGRPVPTGTGHHHIDEVSCTNSTEYPADFIIKKEKTSPIPADLQARSRFENISCESEASEQRMLSTTSSEASEAQERAKDNYLRIVKGYFLCLKCKTKWYNQYEGFFKHVWENHAHNRDFSCCPEGYSVKCPRFTAIIKDIYSKVQEPMAEEIITYLQMNLPESQDLCEHSNINEAASCNEKNAEQGTRSDSNSTHEPTPWCSPSDQSCNQSVVIKSHDRSILVLPVGTLTQQSQSQKERELNSTCDSSANDNECLIQGNHSSSCSSDTQKEAAHTPLSASNEMDRNIQGSKDNTNLASEKSLEENTVFSTQTVTSEPEQEPVQQTTEQSMTGIAGASVTNPQKSAVSKTVYEDISDDDCDDGGSVRSDVGVRCKRHSLEGQQTDLSGDMPLDLSRTSPDRVQPVYEAVTPPDPSYEPPFAHSARDRVSRETEIASYNDESCEASFYQCGFHNCSYTTHKSVDLHDHSEKFHSSEESSSCTYCGYKSISGTELINHMKRHIGVIGKNAFSCTLLEDSATVAQFENEDIKFIIRMLETRSSSKHESDPKFHFVCNVCETHFDSVNNLKDHLQQSVLKVVGCKHCDSYFLDSASWQKHMSAEHPQHSRMYRIHEALLCQDRKVNRESYERLLLRKTHFRRQGYIQKSSDVENRSDMCGTSSISSDYHTNEGVGTHENIEPTKMLASKDQDMQCTDTNIAPDHDREVGSHSPQYDHIGLQTLQVSGSTEEAKEPVPETVSLVEESVSEQADAILDTFGSSQHRKDGIEMMDDNRCPSVVRNSEEGSLKENLQTEAENTEVSNESTVIGINNEKNSVSISHRSSQSESQMDLDKNDPSKESVEQFHLPTSGSDSDPDGQTDFVHETTDSSRAKKNNAEMLENKGNQEPTGNSAEDHGGHSSQDSNEKAMLGKDGAGAKCSGEGESVCDSIEDDVCGLVEKSKEYLDVSANVHGRDEFEHTHSLVDTSDTSDFSHQKNDDGEMPEDKRCSVAEGSSEEGNEGEDDSQNPGEGTACIKDDTDMSRYSEESTTSFFLEDNHLPSQNPLCKKIGNTKTINIITSSDVSSLPNDLLVVSNNNCPHAVPNCVESHVEVTDQKYVNLRCYVCDYRSSDTADFHNHIIISKHSMSASDQDYINSISVKCIKCSFVANGSPDLANHILKEHSALFNNIEGAQSNLLPVPVQKALEYKTLVSVNRSEASDAPKLQPTNMHRLFDVCGLPEIDLCLKSLYTAVDGKFFCKRCKRDFKTIKRVHSHIFFCQGKMGVILCPHCHYQGELSKVVVNHIKLKHKDQNSNIVMYRYLKKNEFLRSLQSNTVTLESFLNICAPFTATLPCSNNTAWGVKNGRENSVGTEKDTNNISQKTEFSGNRVPPDESSKLRHIMSTTDDTGRNEDESVSNKSDKTVVVSNPGLKKRDKKITDKNIRTEPATMFRDLTASYSQNAKQKMGGKKRSFSEDRVNVIKKKSLKLSTEKEERAISELDSPGNAVDFSETITEPRDTLYKDSSKSSTSTSKNGHLTKTDGDKQQFIAKAPNISKDKGDKGKAGRSDCGSSHVPETSSAAVIPEIHKQPSSFANQRVVTESTEVGQRNTFVKRKAEDCQQGGSKKQKVDFNGEGHLSVKKTSLQKESPSFKCSICPFSSYSHTSVKQHLKVEHSGDQKARIRRTHPRSSKPDSSDSAVKKKPRLYQCNHPKCQFMCEWNLDIMQEHINNKHPYYNCGYCRATYSLLHLLKNHLKFVHRGKQAKIEKGIEKDTVAFETLFRSIELSKDGKIGNVHTDFHSKNHHSSKNDKTFHANDREDKLKSGKVSCLDTVKRGKASKVTNGASLNHDMDEAGTVVATDRSNKPDIKEHNVVCNPGIAEPEKETILVPEEGSKQLPGALEDLKDDSERSGDVEISSDTESMNRENRIFFPEDSKKVDRSADSGENDSGSPENGGTIVKTQLLVDKDKTYKVSGLQDSGNKTSHVPCPDVGKNTGIVLQSISDNDKTIEVSATDDKGEIAGKVLQPVVKTALQSCDNSNEIINATESKDNESQADSAQLPAQNYNEQSEVPQHTGRKDEMKQVAPSIQSSADRSCLEYEMATDSRLEAGLSLRKSPANVTSDILATSVPNFYNDSRALQASSDKSAEMFFPASSDKEASKETATEKNEKESSRGSCPSQRNINDYEKSAAHNQKCGGESGEKLAPETATETAPSDEILQVYGTDHPRIDKTVGLPKTPSKSIENDASETIQLTSVEHLMQNMCHKPNYSPISIQNTAYKTSVKCGPQRVDKTGMNASLHGVDRKDITTVIESKRTSEIHTAAQDSHKNSDFFTARSEAASSSVTTNDQPKQKKMKGMDDYPFKCGSCRVFMKSVLDIEEHFKWLHPGVTIQIGERRSDIVFAPSGECLPRQSGLAIPADCHLCRYCSFRSDVRTDIEAHILCDHPDRKIDVVSLHEADQPPLVIKPVHMPIRDPVSVVNRETSLHIPVSEPRNHSSGSRSSTATPARYNCYICNEVLTTEFLFRLHLGKHPGFKYTSILTTTGALLMCPICGYIAKSSSDLGKHTEQHMSERRYKCSHCEVDSHQRNGIVGHQKSFHRNVDNLEVIDRKKLHESVDMRPKLVSLDPALRLKDPFKHHPNYLQRLVLRHDIKMLDLPADICSDILAHNNDEFFDAAFC